MRLAELECGHRQNHPETVSQSVTAFCDECQSVQYIREVIQVPAGLPESNGDKPERSYGCSFGCGNPYDYVFVSVADGTTEFPCLPCFVKLAADIVAAVTSGEGAEMMAAIQEMSTVQQVPHRGRKQRARGHEAPVNADDDGLIEAFDSRITEEELPDDFK